MSAHGKADIGEAVQQLRRAIALHEKHMDGSAPTSGPDGEKSQMAMMGMMKSALAALTGDSLSSEVIANPARSLAKARMGGM